MLCVLCFGILENNGFICLHMFLFLGEIDGFNIPQVKDCPEVGRYLTMPLAELAKQLPREMEGVAKRLFCDGYMYLYQNLNMALYH